MFPTKRFLYFIYVNVNLPKVALNKHVDPKSVNVNFTLR